MERVERAVAAQPIRPEVVKTAFEFFCATGLLPEDQRLAAKVTQQALQGGKVLDADSDPILVADRILEILAGARQRTYGEPGEPQQPSVRKYLFDEAVYGEGIVREAARGVLMLHVAYGHDVTDPQFLADKTLPEFASVGMHLLGYPELLAKPPYVDQAHRLFDRYAELRSRIDRDPEDPWFDRITDAILQFEVTGLLPANELLRDVVLADAELEALWRHKRGQDVSELMELLDKAARAKGEERERAILDVVAVQVRSSRSGRPGAF